MALLTDGYPNDSEALRVYETSILNVANVEQINLDAKLGLATEEISQDVFGILLDHTNSFTGGFAGSFDSLTTRRALGVTDVVVTPQLKRWHALHALAIIYRDAYNNQLNDRYQAKWSEYEILADGAREQTLKTGIGLASTPIPQAAMPTFGNIAGLIPATTYYVAVSWTSAKGQEGAPSALTTFLTAAGSLLVVNAVDPPAVATGWNVYIGLTDGSLDRQNASPIGVGQSFTLPPSGLVSGPAPGQGQAPDLYITGGRMLRRG